MSVLFKRRMNIIGTNQSQAIKNQSIAIKEAKFNDSPNYKLVKINGKYYDAHFLISTEFSAHGNDGSYFIEFRHDVEFPMGTYISIPNNAGHYEMWIITSKSDNVLFPKPAIQKCNHLLKWQNSKGDIIERWSVLRRPYSATLQDSKYIEYSNKQYRILLPLDDETKKLYVDKRFLIEQANGLPLAYSLTAYDTVSESYSPTETILAINVAQCATNIDVDNAELMIADYFDPQSPVKECFIRGDNDFVRIGGTGSTFEGIVINAAGEEQAATTVWTITTTDDMTGQYTYHITDPNKIKIIVKSNYQLIGNLIKLTAEFPEYNMKQEKLIKVVGIV